MWSRYFGSRVEQREYSLGLRGKDGGGEEEEEEVVVEEEEEEEEEEDKVFKRA